MIDIKTNVSLSPYTYSKVGGVAEYFAIANTQVELIDLVKYAHEKQLKLTIIGSASNVIIKDEGLKGLAIINRTQNIEYQENADHTLATADSGVNMNALINQTVDKGLSGLEHFLGLPGTVGGAVYNNAHYNNYLISDLLFKIKIINPQNQIIDQEVASLKFAYDYSIFQESSDIILDVTFSLSKGDPALLRAVANQALIKRKNSQPLEFPSPGCMFKNFTPDFAQSHNLPTHSAGALIDIAGLKGYRVGGVQVSDKHANFLINTGNATATDYQKITDHIINTIKEKYGVILEREVFFL